MMLDRPMIQKPETSRTPTAKTAPPPTPELQLPGVPKERLPRHIAIIMDGNGRWAVERDRPRIFGHEAGAKSVRSIVTECAQLGVEALTLYSFSLENWKRPADEINFLMSLYIKYLVLERAEMLENNIQFIQSGRREGLPEGVLAELDETVEATKACTGMKLILALNYGGRAEITDAMRSLAEDVQAGKLEPSAITDLSAQGDDGQVLVRVRGHARRHCPAPPNGQIQYSPACTPRSAHPSRSNKPTGARYRHPHRCPDHRPPTATLRHGPWPHPPAHATSAGTR